jgi:hypothetical protein
MRDIVYRMADGVEYRLHAKWEMKRSELSTRQKKQARAFLFGCFRQTKCFFTGKPILPQLLHSGAVDIHHVLELGVEGCNLLPNLKLAYHGPNANAGHPRRGIQQDKNRISIDPTTQLRQIVDYSGGSKEMQANVEAEVPYRAWLWEKVLEGGKKGYEKKEAINSGAEKWGVSKQATRDYLDKMISAEGPMFEKKENGIKYIRVRPGRLA